MIKKKKPYLDNIDEKQVSQELWKEINELFSKIQTMVRFKNHIIIYRIIKNGWMKIEDLESATGLTKQRIYQIVNELERKELLRREQYE